MERFLNDCDKDNELELVKEKEVVEEIALVTIIDDDGEEDNSRIVRQNVEFLFKINNDLQNDVLTIEKREEQRFEPREEIRVEISTPTPSKNLTKKHPPEQIIGSKDKGVMTRNRVNEEIYLISQAKPKSAYEACKYDHWIQEIKEELY